MCVCVVNYVCAFICRERERERVDLSSLRGSRSLKNVGFGGDLVF